MRLGSIFRGLSEVGRSVIHTLTRITRLALLQEVSFAHVFVRYGLTWGEHLALAALRRAGPPFRVTPTKLFSSLLLSSGAMTNRLDRLEEMGLVRRLPDPSDRRGRLVELTAKGRRLVDRAVVDHIADEQRLIAPLTRSERQRLAGLLRKLLRRTVPGPGHRTRLAPERPRGPRAPAASDVDP